MSDKKYPIHTLVTNKKALFDYEVVEEYEAGIRLTGSEVKSIRAGQANLKGAYISVSSGVPILMGCHISAYRSNTRDILDPACDRLLLLSKKEISRLQAKVKEMGATIVPVEIYTKGSLLKLRMALAKGRKTWQKKQVLKERDIQRDVERFVSGNRE